MFRKIEVTELILRDGHQSLLASRLAMEDKVTGETITADELGGPLAQMNNSGVVHFIADNDADALYLCRRLLSFLPSNDLEDSPKLSYNFPIEPDPELNDVVPVDNKVPYDMRTQI